MTGSDSVRETEPDAVAKLTSYLPRYLKIARRAGLATDFERETSPTIVGQHTGTGSTDFWGISYAISDFDRQAISDEELERELTLMRACWTFFDEVDLRTHPHPREINGDVGALMDGDEELFAGVDPD